MHKQTTEDRAWEHVVRLENQAKACARVLASWGDGYGPGMTIDAVDSLLERIERLRGEAARQRKVLEKMNARRDEA